MELIAGVGSFTLRFNPSTEVDVVTGGGYEVFVVPEADLVNGDFVPSSSNRIYKGPNTEVTYPCDPGIYGVKAAAYDVFGDTGLNFTELMTVTVRDQVDDMLEKLTGKITRSQLNQLLRDATDLAGDLPNMYMLRVREDGKIAGIGLGVEGGTSAVEILANQFALVDPDAPENSLVPFVLSDGVIYIAKAAIKNADIDTLKIAGNAVTVPFFVHSATVPIAGLAPNTTVELLSCAVDHSGIQYPTVITASINITLPGVASSIHSGLLISATVNRTPVGGALGNNEGFRIVPLTNVGGQTGFTFQVQDPSPPAAVNTYRLMVNVMIAGDIDQSSLDVIMGQCNWQSASLSILGAKR